MNGDVDTEPLPLLAATAALILGAFIPEMIVTPVARHAIRRRRDGELLAVAVALFACGGLCAGLVPFGLTPTAAAAWMAAGATALALAGAHRDPRERANPWREWAPPPPELLTADLAREWDDLLTPPAGVGPWRPAEAEEEETETETRVIVDASSSVSVRTA